MTGLHTLTHSNKYLHNCLIKFTDPLCRAAELNLSVEPLNKTLSFTVELRGLFPCRVYKELSLYICIEIILF